MDFKQIIQSVFKYTPDNTYNFDIIANVNNNEAQENTLKKINSNLNTNLDYIKTVYNTLINSDIVIRKFTLNARNKQFDAFILYVDGLIDTNLMNDFVLKPLMLRNTSNLYDKGQNKVSNSKQNKVVYTRIKKFDITKYLLNSLMPQNSVKIIDTFEKVYNGVNSGNCVLFIDTLNKAFDIEVKGFKQRSIDSPKNEVIIKGSQEAFVESLRTNTSIIRRIINNENLIIENLEVGKITKTKCGLCYMKNITNEDLIAEVKYRINNLAIDSLISSRRARTTYFR
ncbi:MAG: spore germination protein [Clostridia bacterium]|nr:spore germination protein [Clostridia bacterium]